MKKQPAKLLAVVLVGVAAIIWTIACVFDFMYETPPFLRALRVVCALVWYVAFFVNLYRYRRAVNNNT